MAVDRIGSLICLALTALERWTAQSGRSTTHSRPRDRHRLQDSFRACGAKRTQLADTWQIAFDFPRPALLADQTGISAPGSTFRFRVGHVGTAVGDIQPRDISVPLRANKKGLDFLDRKRHDGSLIRVTQAHSQLQSIWPRRFVRTDDRGCGSTEYTKCGVYSCM